MSEKKVNILIVDDDAFTRNTFAQILRLKGYNVELAGRGADAIAQIKAAFFNIVFIDIRLPDMSGLQVLKSISEINEDTVSIMLTAYASVDSSIEAMNQGAYSYITKPVNMDHVISVIDKALEKQWLSMENRRLLKDLAVMNKQLTELSLKDTHTELHNYRYLMERLALEVERARRYVLPLSVIMLDIDYFKSINDVYGHQCGDMILKEFAHCLKDFARTIDIVTRYGGEEFVIVLSDTNKNGAIIFGERLLDVIGKHLFDPEGKKIKLKVSIGLASFPEDGGDTGTASGLINSADKALLKAKEKGGNQLCTFRDIGKDIEDIVEEGGKENVYELRKKLSKMSDRVDKTLLESIYAFAKTISAKDYYTAEHSENMVSIAVEIGKKLNLSSGVLKTLEQAAILHDLGKVGVPDEILHKKGKLTKEEYEIVKKHPQIGAEIIRPIHFLDKLVPIILYHHERFDGLGYSAGLKGKEIPLGARIVTVADVYQALVSDRPYRKAYSQKEALEIIRQGSGTQFDPEIVEAFLAIIE